MKNKNQGITLIALIVTIIVLLILAGVTIATLTGKNGMLNKANTASEETQKKKYEEILKIIGNGLRPNKIINNWSGKTFLDEFQKEIPKNEELKEAQVNRKNDETIIVITKEGYVYRITENEVTYIGKQGEVEIPKLEESNIQFSYNPSPEDKQWTNQNVEVSITTSNEISENYELQYSMDGTSWDKYHSEITMEGNGAVHARLINELYETICVATGNVKNIDKEEPNEAIITFSKTEITEGEPITATVTQSDNGVSGVNITECKFAFTTNNTPIGTEDLSKYSEDKFTTENADEIELNCPEEGEYYLHVLTVDRAGNLLESISKEKVKANGRVYFDISSFGGNYDFPSVELAYTRSKETQTSEQTAVMESASNLIKNVSLYNARNLSTNNWILLGQSQNQLIDNYYLYDRYSVTTTSWYEEGTWSAWSASWDDKTYSSNSWVLRSYTFNPADGTFTIGNGTSFSGENYVGRIHYGRGSSVNVGRTITRYEVVGTFWPTLRSSTMTSVLKSAKTQGTLEGELIAKGGIYKDNAAHTDNKWYKQKEQAKAYYIYKYMDNEIQTTYDVGNSILNTKKIDFGKNKESIRILIDSNTIAYKLSISKDNQNWIEITDRSLLKGESKITLPEPWNCVYIKIERTATNTYLNRIRVN